MYQKNLNGCTGHVMNLYNAPAHHERPKLDLRLQPESQQGSDAVARQVRLSL
jgi:hypothetical protein